MRRSLRWQTIDDNYRFDSWEKETKQYFTLIFADLRYIFAKEYCIKTSYLISLTWLFLYIVSLLGLVKYNDKRCIVVKSQRFKNKLQRYWRTQNSFSTKFQQSFSKNTCRQDAFWPSWVRIFLFTYNVFCLCKNSIVMDLIIKISTNFCFIVMCDRFDL